MYGMHEPAGVGVYTGLDGLRRYITEGRKERLGESAGPPLARDALELEQFLGAYHVPMFIEPEADSRPTTGTRRVGARAVPRRLSRPDVHRARG